MVPCKAARMPLWKTTLAYDGTPYHGWQIQPALPTVQGTLAAVLHRVTGETVLPQGSGRTDTGVHALGQVASFFLKGPIPGANLKRALNHHLPPSIRVLSVESAPRDFHARHSARAKTYEYRIFPRRPPVLDGLQAVHPPPPEQGICSPMLAPFVWDTGLSLSLPALRMAAALVLGRHDFTSFAASSPDPATPHTPLQPQPDYPVSPPSPCRTLFASDWGMEGDLLVYRVTGSGFLHHMVRNLVGTFVEAGAGRTAPDRMPAILAARDRSAAGPTAPARGLFLVGVEY